MSNFDLLIARKLRMDEKREATIIYDIGDDALVFRRLPNEKAVEALNEIGAQPTVSGIYEISRKLIYDSCERLRDPELHKALEIIDPYDTVDALLETVEILDLGEKIMTLNGLDDLAGDIKN